MPKFGVIPPEPPVIVAIDSLAPRMASATRAMLEVMKGRGHDATIRETLRTAERQAWLYGFGRSYDDGRGIVTNVSSIFNGWHPFGLAVDVVSLSLQDAAPGAFWQDLGEAAEHAGLAAAMVIGNAGGFFRRDRPHIQWAACRISPTWRTKALYQLGGKARIWRAVGAA